METKRQILVIGNEVYEECTVTSRRKIKDMDAIIDNIVAQRMSDMTTVSTGKLRMDKIPVNFTLNTQGRLVFARPFAAGPLGLKVKLINVNDEAMRPCIGPKEENNTVLVYDKNFFCDIEAGQATPRHWLTYNPETKMVTCVLIYKGRTFHPLLPNVFDDSHMCTGDTFNRSIQNMYADNPNATVFDEFRIAFNNVLSTAWNNDLSGHFATIRFNKERKLTPYSVNRLIEISNGDHSKELFR